MPFWKTNLQHPGIFNEYGKRHKNTEVSDAHVKALLAATSSQDQMTLTLPRKQQPAKYSYINATSIISTQQLNFLDNFQCKLKL